MFEKCELATTTPRDPKIKDDICTSQTLDEDFAEFAKQVRNGQKIFIQQSIFFYYYYRISSMT
jgi:hypothetical protein